MRVHAWLLAMGLTFAPAASVRADAGQAVRVVADATHAAPGERELLGRLIAPCCWNQTLDIHGGAVPDQLRAEIRERLLAGEAASAIEADFVARYGERVRAQSSSATLGTAGLVVIGLSLLAGVGVAAAVRRWVRAGRRPPVLAGSPETTDKWDARLDDELRALD